MNRHSPYLAAADLRRTGYRADIDGLRAVAVLAVVFYHAGFSWLPGGYVGVDVFFVISGYLITSIIAAELERGEFTILGFYDRRIRRILPASVAMTTITALAAAAFLMPFDYKQFGQSLVANSLFASNVYFFAKTGYFNQEAELKPLLHTWSLSVEEQFYVGFPLLLAAVHRHAPRFVKPILLSLCVLSLLACVAQTREDAPAAFFLLPFRAWELLVGALLALGAIPTLRSRAARDLTAAAGLAAIAASVVCFTGELRYPGEAAALPVFGSAAVIHAGSSGDARALRLLSNRPMVFIGLISYSLYLWHWPIVFAYRYLVSLDVSPSHGLALAAISLAAAALSWRFVERPLRDPRFWRSRRAVVPAHAPLFCAAAICIAASAAAGAAIHATNGWPSRLPDAVAVVGLAALDHVSHGACLDRSPAQIRRGDLCVLGAPGTRPDFVLLGDSFADAMSPGLDLAARRAGRSGWVMTRAGCRPMRGAVQGDTDCKDYVEAALDFVHAHPELKTVVIVGRWTTSVEGTRFGVDRHGGIFVADAQSRGLSYEENYKATLRSLLRTLDALPGLRIVFGAYIPEQAVNVPRAAALALWRGASRRIEIDRRTFDERQLRTHALFAELAKQRAFTMLDFGARMCDESRCIGAENDDIRYSDDNHVSRSFAIRISEAFDPVFHDEQRNEFAR